MRGTFLCPRPRVRLGGGALARARFRVRFAPLEQSSSSSSSFNLTRGGGWPYTDDNALHIIIKYIYLPTFILVYKCFCRSHTTCDVSRCGPTKGGLVGDSSLPLLHPLLYTRDVSPLVRPQIAPGTHRVCVVFSPLPQTPLSRVYDVCAHTKTPGGRPDRLLTTTTKQKNTTELKIRLDRGWESKRENRNNRTAYIIIHVSIQNIHYYIIIIW